MKKMIKRCIEYLRYEVTEEDWCHVWIGFLAAAIIVLSGVTLYLWFGGQKEEQPFSFAPSDYYFTCPPRERKPSYWDYYIPESGPVSDEVRFKVTVESFKNRYR